jgi:hypothetical protein
MAGSFGNKEGETHTNCPALMILKVIFKMSFWCLQIFQKNNNFFFRIPALASKKRSNQKSSVKESK